MDNQKVIYSHMEYYLAIIANEGLIHAATWMNLQEASCKGSHGDDSIDRKSPEEANLYREVDYWLPGAGGWEEMRSDGLWEQGFLWGDKNVLKMTVVMAAYIYEHTKN